MTEEKKSFEERLQEVQEIISRIEEVFNKSLLERTSDTCIVESLPQKTLLNLSS